MDGYIKKSEAVDVIVKYPYDIAGKTATAIKMIEDLPSADVVLRAELAVRSFKDAATIYNLQEINKKLVSGVEELVQVGTRLGQENETLKDNNEHLAVILEETKAEVEKLQNELVIWKQNRFNLFQRLECYETARRKLASEIFAEIESKKMFLKDCVGNMGVVVLFKDITELKKKYEVETK